MHSLLAMLHECNRYAVHYLLQTDHQFGMLLMALLNTYIGENAMIAPNMIYLQVLLTNTTLCMYVLCTNQSTYDVL